MQIGKVFSHYRDFPFSHHGIHDFVAANYDWLEANYVWHCPFCFEGFHQKALINESKQKALAEHMK